MSDIEMLRSLEHGLRTAPDHPDLLQSRPLDPVLTQLASHRFIFEKLPSRELAKLFVALNGFADSRLDALHGKVGAALFQRMKEMELSPPVVQSNPARKEEPSLAAVHAAFVDRLISLKEDIETLGMLANESSSLTRERRTELAGTITKAAAKTIVKLAEVMLQGTEEKSTRLISRAVELARTAHAILVGLNPHNTPDLQSLMTEALLTPELSSQVRDAEVICAGKYVNANFKLTDEVNDVSAAASRQIDGTDTSKNREAVDVQLFRRALGYAFKPEWSEPEDGAGIATTHGLFGDGWGWPTPGVDGLKTELSREKKHWAVDDSESIKGLLTFLEGFHKIKNAGRMTQQEAERQMAPLQTLILKHEVGEALGSQLLPFRWDLAPLKGLGPEARVAALHKMVEPARVQAQRQIVTRVNIQRPIIANIKKVNADSRQRQEMRVATGHKADTSAAQARIAAYEAAEKAKAEEAAAKAANTGNSV